MKARSILSEMAEKCHGNYSDYAKEDGLPEIDRSNAVDVALLALKEMVENEQDWKRCDAWNAAITVVADLFGGEPR